ncbi:hypothetical protein FPOAC2_07722 [Fusarium poae]|uniref:hypothetical protein n=1 Tax=Fusarium poae TaxID=36050 RepID=UPI001CEAC2DB|nr:hypothetical protein FPOAC1_007819 [Fusarium poae]KAG8668440.1 hypothetical protein FPOAC1_007819 [Fusarium poae]
MPPYLPDEVLNEIFSHLLTPNRKHHFRHDWHDDCTQVRLVCKRWNVVATQHLLSTVVLRHSCFTMNDNFRSWHKLLNSRPVRNSVRRIAIETALQVEEWGSDDRGACEVSRWPLSWRRDGKWREFESAVNRLRHLPNLDAIEVRFTSTCIGPAGETEEALEYPDYVNEPREEPPSTRLYTLEAIARAMYERNSHTNWNMASELVLENLQNSPLPQNIMQYLLEGIERLHLKIVAEGDGTWSRPEPVKQLYREELREFPGFLEEDLFYRVSKIHLVDLTLAGKNWGGIPGHFRASSIKLPSLKTLTLEGLTILNQDQFDWVLRTTTLTSLRLHSCAIATHCLVLQPEFSFWDVSLQGWKRVKDNTYAVSQHRHPISHTPDPGALVPGWYVNPLRWATLFGSIAERLRLLKNFSFDGEVWETYFRQDKQDDCSDGMEGRYLGFAQGWSCLNEPHTEWFEHCGYIQDGVPGKPEELLELTRQTDGEALEEVLRTVKERRSADRRHSPSN